MTLVFSPSMMSSQEGLPPFSSGSPGFDGRYYTTVNESPSYPSRSSPPYQRNYQPNPSGRSRTDSSAVYQSSRVALSVPASRNSAPGGLQSNGRGMGQQWQQDYPPQNFSPGIPIASPEARGYQSYPQSGAFGSIGVAPPPVMSQGYSERDAIGRRSPDLMMRDLTPPSPSSSDYLPEHFTRRPSDGTQPMVRYNTQRKPSNRDVFNGPHQLLDPPSPRTLAGQDRDLPHLPTNLDVLEQDEILNKVNDCLAKCAFNFVAKYGFPIPIEDDKRPVRTPVDREWTEWAYLLKKLATKRRIPRHVLYNGQVKQLITILDNSLEMRHAAMHQSRPLKDDRNVLQLISAGIQVAKILKDASAMELLDHLYVRTERIIQERRGHRGTPRSIA